MLRLLMTFFKDKPCRLETDRACCESAVLFFWGLFCFDENRKTLLQNYSPNVTNRYIQKVFVFTALESGG
ncbi:MAG: hypothetical protein E6Q42_10135 [Dechloromonas sp.]|nr:MAG: hypothetical protein E6Q42_10135 [Dechloromonas sp.]